MARAGTDPAGDVAAAAELAGALRGYNVAAHETVERLLALLDLGLKGGT